MTHFSVPLLFKCPFLNVINFYRKNLPIASFALLGRRLSTETQQKINDSYFASPKLPDSSVQGVFRALLPSKSCSSRKEAFFIYNNVPHLIQLCHGSLGQERNGIYSLLPIDPIRNTVATVLASSVQWHTRDILFTNI